MSLFKATIEVLVDVEDMPAACDCVAEALRPILRKFEPDSSVIDWRYHDSAPVPQLCDGAGFEFAEEVP